MDKKVVVYHPGRQHSFYTALAVQKAGVLDKFFTSLYHTPKSRRIKITEKLLKGESKRRLENKYLEGLDHNKISLKYVFLSILVILLKKKKSTFKLGVKLDRKISNAYGIKVAKYAIKHKVDAVICFSTNEYSCFKYLEKHAPHIKRIVDYSNAPREFMRHIYDKDIEKFGSNYLKREISILWSGAKAENVWRESVVLPDCFLVSSFFVKRGLEFCGVQKDKVKITPLGSQIEIGEAKMEVPENITFIYVGQVTYRKGMHHLFNAFTKLNRDDVQLNVVGAYRSNSPFYAQYKNDKRIKFFGAVSHSKIKEILNQASVMVFCSLSDSWGLAVSEAMACGLPVIVSSNTGASDSVIDGQNGFIVQADDEDAIKEKMQFFIDNKHLIPKFSEKSIENSKKFTWLNFDGLVQKALDEILY